GLRVWPARGQQGVPRAARRRAGPPEPAGGGGSRVSGRAPTDTGASDGSPRSVAGPREPVQVGAGRLGRNAAPALGAPILSSGVIPPEPRLTAALGDRY